jgi:capsular polysaccharide export protein
MRSQALAVAEARPDEQRLFAFNGGLLRPGRVRRILTLAGLRPVPGLPGPGDLVGVWGQSPHARRGAAIAALRGAALVRIEDAFLRSIRPGWAGDAPLGLMIDRTGVHFDGLHPSDLETLLATHPLDDAALMSRARDGIARLRLSDLSKYNLHDPGLAVPDPGFVLMVDQVLSDASVRAGGGSAATFRAMLDRALSDHPEARIVIRTHPEAALGLRAGAYGTAQPGGRVAVLTDPVSPWALLSGATAVYTLSSQLGFEAILAGHRPQVFGRPFYAGWGLTQDHAALPRRRRTLTPEQLFAAAMILMPVWHDPCRDRLCTFEDALDQLEAEVRAFRQDRHGHVAMGMRLWKRPRLQAVFGREMRLRFADDPARVATMAQAQGRTVIAWASRAPAVFPLPLTRVEDDASIRLGAGAVRTNLALLQAVRKANPGAVILFKPHPDVEAGLRPGTIPPEDLAGLADGVLTRADPAQVLAVVQEVWTMTSLLGFEALIRGLPVTCLGAPFYAGWGLTRDLGPVPDRRSARPSVSALAHAVLIAYPRYHDPVSRRPCPPEVAADRLAAGRLPAGPVNRLLARAQGLLASRPALWR